MEKNAKVFGVLNPMMAGVDEVTPSSVLPEYHRYLIRKASEPQSSYAFTTILPGLFGALAGGIIGKKNRVASALGGFAVGAAPGTVLKIMDDNMIDRARMIQSSGKSYKDPEIGMMEEQMIIADRAANKNIAKQVLNQLSNLGNSNAGTK